MKGQGLSMQTIAVIIIAIIVLAGVAIFFFAYMSKGKGLLGQQAGYSKDKTTCATIQSCAYTKGANSCSDIHSKCTIPQGLTCKVYDNNGDECTCTSSSCTQTS